jgi:hypothetical protein
VPGISSALPTEKPTKKAIRFATTGFSILVATDQLPFGSTLEISETFSIGSEAFE